MVPAAELNYDTSATAVQMAQEIFGDDSLIVSATYSGSANSSAIYSNGDALAPAATPGDTGVILSTGNAASYTNSSGEANQNAGTSTNTGGLDNDAQFNTIAGLATFDASVLEIRFIPDSSVYSIQFTYASEEYPEFVSSIYNDIVGVWVNDEYVELAVGSGDSNIGNINATNNQNLHVDNTADVANTEMDGFTVTLTLTLNVDVGVENTLRIGIADVGDSNFDSNLLIAGESIQDQVVLSDDEFDIPADDSAVINVLGNDTESSGGTLTITHINGENAVVGVPVLLSTGQQVTLNSDGTFTVETDSDEESFTFTYAAENSDGVDDVAFVTINTLPCFTAGTRILTEFGERPVEELEEGDLIQTYDSGLQPLRWIGRRTVEADGTMAPIQIAANTFGQHRALVVSPQHRVMLRALRAELFFGEQEVLVAAKDLVDGHAVKRLADGQSVTYIHLLFDAHQVIFSEGLPTESFLPGPQTMTGFERESVQEICSLFPKIDPKTGLGYGAAARTSLKSYETHLLMGGARAA